MMKQDKKIEMERYGARARLLKDTSSPTIKKTHFYGSMEIPPVFSAPYVYYEQCISKYVSKENDVLEIGSGTGLHTTSLRQTGAQVVASDISINTLEVLAQHITSVTTIVADMEALPFKKDSFDVIASAGSLSYGEPTLVDAEIKRVLRPGGIFICVDSLNHNPIYRINRWVHCLRERRTKSTLIRMPNIDRIQKISEGFKEVDVKFFGSISHLMPILAFIVGQRLAAMFSDAIDRMVKVRRSAFKFVLVAKGRL
ncbi:hypothetical protein PITCH_A270010 [uncultured Desulfobacterium sp.]|uniref:Methyltransferase type 11 domain-containing protein n=1 Tax=uncultured Desulfobacterium sp. TaxID=201089 RepID=A0A445MYJ8_9BACT|nr:hypothetical protein PITCH_A270010 [uncultured Desulfobacterium sp.]